MLRAVPVLLLVLSLGVPAAAAGASCLDAGWTLFRSGRLSRAAETYSAPSCVAAAGAEAYRSAGVVYRDLGRDQESLRAFEKAAALAPGDADTRAALGEAAWRARRLDLARSAFEEALKRDQSQPWALLGLSRVERAGGDARAAAETLEKLTRSRPSLSLAWLELGRARAAAGEKAAAARAYQRAFEADRSFGEARLFLARLYQEMGRSLQAWRQYAKVLLLDPGQAAARLAAAALAPKVGRSAADAVPRAPPLEPLAAHRAAPAAGMPFIRVGIGSSAAGHPLPRRALAFRCTGRFLALDPGTGRRLAEGRGGEDYLVSRARDGRFEVVDAGRRRLLRFRRDILIRPAQPKDTLVLREVRVAKGYEWTAVSDRQLKGTLELRARKSGLYAVNRLPLEDYLYGVVTEEMPERFPLEALKAQAIIARGHALFGLRHHRHGRDGYDVCDGQHCQVYSGMAGESPRSREAVDATRGLVLRYHGRLAQTVYTSNCGGATQDSGELDGWTRLPYLKGSADAAPGVFAPASPWQLELWLRGRPRAYCRSLESEKASIFRWTRAVPAAALERRANRRRRIGRLKRLLVTRRSRAGNANEVRLEGTRGVLTLRREQRIRATLGLGGLRSTLFTVTTERDAQGRPSEFLFYGGGWGHGVGLCQYGAAGRAAAGQTYREILAHYYPGAKARKLDYR